MISQRAKDLIFYGVGFYSLAARPFIGFRFRNAKNLRLHMGSYRTKLPGFVNMDANPLAEFDLLYDVRRKLPFKENSVKFIYASHILEHFYHDELFRVLNEFHRVLQPNGILRVIVPDLEKSILNYVNKNSSSFADKPRNFKSIGGRFVNFIFCDAQHKTAFDFDFMKEALTVAGFKEENIHKSSSNHCLRGEEIPEGVKQFEKDYSVMCLFVDAVR